MKKILLFSLFILAACNSDTGEESSLKLAGVNYLGDLPTFVASKNNLFQKNNLNVEVSVTDSGKQNLDRLLAGEVDFALMSTTPFVLDKLANADVERQGSEPVILGSLMHSTQVNQILAIKDRNIQTVNALEGGKVGLTKGTNAEYLWWLYSIFYQLPADSVEIIDLPVAKLGSALIDGKVDAIVTWQPWTNHFIDGYPDQIEQLEGSHVYNAKWLLVTNRQMAEENPKYCQQILKSYADAIRLIQSDTKKVMQMYNDEAYKRTSVISSYQPGLHQLNLNWSLIADLHQGIQWAKLNNFPGAENQTNVSAWFAPEPLQAIYPFLVKIPIINNDENQP